MTDLGKAKQWRILNDWDGATEDDRLAAYASHSNSELLERVQKLEQALLEIAEYGEARSFQIYAGIMARRARRALAKAPETRNV